MAEYAITLAIDMYAGEPVDPWEGNKHTDRGTELEPQARDTYSLLHDVDTEQVGFITDDYMEYGCSPDSLVGDDRLLEIKCLKAENHIKALMYYQKHEKCPPKYIPPTQGQMFVCERDYCDLVFFHPKLPMITIRQKRDPVIIAALEKQLAAVIAERNIIVAAIKAF